VKKTTIQLQNLSTGYRENGGNKLVSSNISADIESNELTCLIGANGIGKSTLMRTLAAFQPKISGEIMVQGKEIDAYTDKELARIISVVLTERCDIQNMTVEELVGLGRSPYTGFWGTLNDADKEVVKQSIAWVGIEHLSQRHVQTLSDGERQKTMIAKALAQETPIIFLDEPTAFLDMPNRYELCNLLRSLAHNEGKCILFSTHDVDAALPVCDSFAIIEEERLRKLPTPDAATEIERIFKL
jgi:iron complex transport system ATP-binding protein